MVGQERGPGDGTVLIQLQYGGVLTGVLIFAGVNRESVREWVQVISLMGLGRIPGSGCPVPVIRTTQFTLSGLGTMFHFHRGTNCFVIFSCSLIYAGCSDNVIFVRLDILSFLSNTIGMFVESIHPFIHTHIYLKDI